MICTIKLPDFEGPLDLLLYLVEKHELDIYRINVAAVAQQYLAHLRAFEQLDLDLASEFYLMAVRLLAIKARALLPSAALGEDDPETGSGDDDPRRALIRELVAYRICRRRASALGDMAANQARRYGRPVLASEDPDEGHWLGTNVGPSAAALAETYGACLARARRREPRMITGDGASLRQRMALVLRSLRKADGILFSAISRLAESRREIVVTFLALLELLRRRRITAQQPEAFGEIRLGLVRRAKGEGSG